MTKRNQINRAKEIFSATYNYPAIPFRSIGRAAFAWAMAEAAREAREAARIAAIPAEVRAARLEQINRALVMLDYRHDYTRASIERRDLLAERRTLAA